MNAMKEKDEVQTRHGLKDQGRLPSGNDIQTRANVYEYVRVGRKKHHRQKEQQGPDGRSQQKLRGTPITC